MKKKKIIILSIMIIVVALLLEASILNMLMTEMPIEHQRYFLIV